MQLSVKLEAFEGPLDLLLHLIKKHEIDIFDIPIHFITERFLEAVADMKQLDLDVGGEYLVMAATLTQIKSRQLLPRPEADEEAEQEDPRADLVRQLVEYQQYKELAERLDERALLGRNVFVRPPLESDKVEGETQPARSLDLFELLDAFDIVKRRACLKHGLKVAVERRTVVQEMRRIAMALSGNKRHSFWRLVEPDEVGDQTIASLVGTFLAILELTRWGLIRVTQSGSDRTKIFVRAAVPDLESAVEALHE